MMVECEYCKTSFNATPRDLGRGRGKFCSKECKDSSCRAPPKTLRIKTSVLQKLYADLGCVPLMEYKDWACKEHGFNVVHPLTLYTTLYFKTSSKMNIVIKDLKTRVYQSVGKSWMKSARTIKEYTLMILMQKGYSAQYLRGFMDGYDDMAVFDPKEDFVLGHSDGESAREAMLKI